MKSDSPFDELVLHKEATLDALRRRDSIAFSRHLDSYERFVEATLSQVAASTYPTEIRADLPLANRLRDDIAHIAFAAADTLDVDLIQQTVAKARHLLLLALRNRSPSFFEGSLRLHRFLLQKSYDLPDGAARRFLKDRAWRNLRDFSGLMPRKAEDMDLGAAIGCVRSLMREFSDMLKTAIDRLDISAYQIMGNAFNQTFEYVHDLNPHWQHARAVEDEADRLRDVAWFGLGAWVVREVIRQTTPGNNPQIDASAALMPFLRPVVNRYTGVRALSEIYFRSSEEVETFQWDMWELETLPEGQAHWIRFEQWLTYEYCLLGIGLAARQDWREEDQVPQDAETPVPHKRIKHILRDVSEAVEAIARAESLWRGLLDEDSIEKRCRFVRLHEAAAAEQTRAWNTLVRAAPLDPARILAFKTDFLREWASHAWLDALFRKHGVTEIVNLQEGQPVIGMRLHYPKEFFIAEQEAEWIDFGPGEAREMARTTNNALLRKVLDSAIAVAPETPWARLEAVLGEETDNHIGAGQRVDSLLVVGGFELESLMAGLPDLTPRWSQSMPLYDNSAFLGTYKGTPVFFVRDDTTSCILVVDLASLGRFRVFAIDGEGTDAPFVRVTPITQVDLDRQGIVDEDKRRAYDTKVLVDIKYAFELVVENRVAIRRIYVGPGGHRIGVTTGPAPSIDNRGTSPD